MADQSAYDRNQRAAERQHDQVNDLGKTLTEAYVKDAQEAIKVILLINSGAAVAILAFISTIAARSGITLTNLKAVTNSLHWFTWGIVSSGVTAAFAYLANSLYAGHLSAMDKIWEHPYVRENAKSRRMLRWAKFFNWSGFILAWLGLLLFIRGVYVAAHAIEKLVGTR
jgi:hypothetical protein